MPLKLKAELALLKEAGAVASPKASWQFSGAWSLFAVFNS